jgi:hypothetical protein
VVFVQLDLDIAVLRADRSGVVVGHIDAADRKSDIVDHRAEVFLRNDLSNRLFDFGKLLRAFLNARTDAVAHMEEDLAGVDRREEVTAEIGRERE